jgi:carbonic anhydrase
MRKSFIIVPFIFVLALTGCSSFSRKNQATTDTIEPAPTLIADHSGQVTAVTHENAEIHVTPTLLNPKEIQLNPTTTSHKMADGVPSEVALRWLKNGNTRFVKGNLRNDGQSHKDIERLTSGQKPHTVIISCSDSRVPPEIIFDQKLGEIFVIRTAGETLDPTSIASIEYALEHLGTKNLMVMGHTQCGAVTAALSTLDGKDAGSDNLNKLVADIHPRIAAYKGRVRSANLAEESWANVNGVIADLQKRSKIINDKVKSHDVQISGSLYHLDSGKVEFK